VALEPLKLAWHGFVLSRAPVRLDGQGYGVRARGAGYWRYELGGEALPPSWPAFARERLGEVGDWVEFFDEKAGYYRGARLVDGQLHACCFVSPKTRLPDRGWVGRLFDVTALGEAERMSLLAGRPADSSTAVGPVVCACHGVGRDALIRVISGGEAVCLKDIGKLLKAGTNCGSCIPELNGLIAAHGHVGVTATARPEVPSFHLP
jgi:assimilatory nitrate reductase catalytic subunit